MPLKPDGPKLSLITPFPKPVFPPALSMLETGIWLPSQTPSPLTPCDRGLWLLPVKCRLLFSPPPSSAKALSPHTCSTHEPLTGLQGSRLSGPGSPSPGRVEPFLKAGARSHHFLLKTFFWVPVAFKVSSTRTQIYPLMLVTYETLSTLPGLSETTLRFSELWPKLSKATCGSPAKCLFCNIYAI